MISEITQNLVKSLGWHTWTHFVVVVVKLGVAPSTTFKFITQAVVGVTPQWFGLGP